jgi:hypothetical protein
LTDLMFRFAGLADLGVSGTCADECTRAEASALPPVAASARRRHAVALRPSSESAAVAANDVRRTGDGPQLPSCVPPRPRRADAATRAARPPLPPGPSGKVGPDSDRCQGAPIVCNSKILAREPKILKSEPGNEPGAAFQECGACSRRRRASIRLHRSRIRRMLAGHSATARVATTDGSRGTAGAVFTIHRLQNHHRRMPTSMARTSISHSANAREHSRNACGAFAECSVGEPAAMLSHPRMLE